MFYKLAITSVLVVFHSLIYGFWLWLLHLCVPCTVLMEQHIFFAKFGRFASNQYWICPKLWIIFSSGNDTMCIPKNCGHDLVHPQTFFAFLGARSPRKTHCLNFSCSLVCCDGSMFHHYVTAQKLVCIVLVNNTRKSHSCTYSIQHI